MKSKKVVLLVLATVLMLGLAAVAVITSLKLKQLSTVPVAPNVPVSQPRAAEEPSYVCQTSFTVAEEVVYSCYQGPCATNDQCETGYVCQNKPGTTDKVCLNAACPSSDDCICEAGLGCTSKSAYKDDSRNEAGSYYLDVKLEAEDVVQPGDKIVYKIGFENTGEASNSAIITDILPEKVVFLDADVGCSYDQLSRKVTCDGIVEAAGEGGQRGIRVQVSEDATAGEIVNTATLTPTTGDVSSCAVTLNLEIEATSTPTPSPTGEPRELSCNDYCANTDECPGGFICSGNQCRKTECVADNDCVCEDPPGCNEVCNPDNENNECVGGYVCDRASNTCRNTACSGETDCTCAVAGTYTAPAEELPDAGSPVPGFLFLVAGAMLLILGVMVVGL